MSHYAVAVITKTGSEEEVDRLLAPFSEELSVEPYIDKTYDEVLSNIIKCHSEDVEKGIASKVYTDIYNAYKENKPKSEIVELIKKTYWLDPTYDDDGNHLTTYNPNSKWDWWVIGGRWTDYIPGNKLRIVNILARQPDLDYSDESLQKQYKKEYGEWKDIQDLKNVSYYKPGYLKSLYPTFKDYLIEQVCFNTYAVVDEDGWHEPGKVGWFGCTSSSVEDSINWNRNYLNYLNEQDPEKFITVVDCHI